jgi:ABC-type transport system involved in cytochrome c biogenesis permease subunit
MGLREAVEALVILLYFAGTALFFAGLLTGRERLKQAGALCAVAGFGCHTLDLVLFLTLHQKSALVAGRFYFSLLAWCVLLVYFLLWWRLKLKFLALTASPLALLLFISSLAAMNLKVLMPKQAAGLFFGLHIGSLFASLGLMTMGFGAAIAFLHLNKRIKSKSPLGRGESELPSLNAFDRVNHWAIVAGFPLYTLGLFSGFLWAHITWSKIFSWDPKEIAALAVWFLYALLFHQRVMLGWRGRKTAVLLIWVFAISVVSLVGINFLAPSHHSFKPNP